MAYEHVSRKSFDNTRHKMMMTVKTQHSTLLQHTDGGKSQCEMPKTRSHAPVCVIQCLVAVTDFVIRHILTNIIHSVCFVLE